jgi:hypothetical protein
MLVLDSLRELLNAISTYHEAFFISSTLVAVSNGVSKLVVMFRPTV